MSTPIPANELQGTAVMHLGKMFQLMTPGLITGGSGPALSAQNNDFSKPLLGETHGSSI